MNLMISRPVIKEKERGTAIGYALVIIAMISIIFSSVVQFVATQAKSAYQNQSREQAFQVAEAGVNFYRWYLAHQTDGKNSVQVREFWQNTSPYPLGLGDNYGYEREYVDAQGGSIGRFKMEIDQEPDPGSTIVDAVFTGWTYKYPNIKRKIKVRFRRPSWSENSVLANDFMRFGEGTTVDGKIHSNSGIRFDGVATNVVSSSLSSFDDPDHDEIGNDKLEFGVHTHVNPSGGVNESFRSSEAPPNPVQIRTDVFKAGRKFPVPQIDFASVVSVISDMRSQAAIKFDNSGAGRRIMLKTDDTFDVCKVSEYDLATSTIEKYSGLIVGATGSFASNNGKVCPNTTSLCCNNTTIPCDWVSNSNHAKGKCVTMTNHPIPNDGVIFVANNIWLEGTINGRRVSFVAAELSDEPVGGGVPNSGIGKNVFLGMNNLRYTNSNGEDIIGIIAENDVEIVKNSLTNLTIDGALLAKEGRVGRKKYGNNKNTITINGAIATNVRYGFAYVGNDFNCGGGVTVSQGYCFRNLNFDNNLLYHPPPYFPTGTQYTVDLWEEI
ncbi:MAG: hypothetical protein HGA61_00840 [Candidatus Moranbacteria bacterium]|nr:hypothetical protein [Candidatus Moranbacteria bacterium]